MPTYKVVYEVRVKFEIDVKASSLDGALCSIVKRLEQGAGVLGKPIGSYPKSAELIRDECMERVPAAWVKIDDAKECVRLMQQSGDAQPNDENEIPF